MSLRKAALALSLLYVLSLVGCGENALESVTAQRMKGLANAYLDHVVGAGGPPKDEAALKKHMLGLRGSVQYDYKIDPANVDASFISERDKQPLVVTYDKDIGKISGNSTHVIAHEKTGVGGKRLVVFASTKVDLVNESELEQLKTQKAE